MQEDIENKSVTVIIKGTKITAKLLAKALAATVRQIQKQSDAPGKKSVKQLAKGGSLQNVEVSDKNIKAFEPVARKYGVRYALVKDTSEEPPKWLVFFRSKDTDSLTAAFSEFARRTVKREHEKPSVRETMQKFKEIIKHAVIDKTRHKERSGHEL
jgi:hypothetical protein